MRKTTKIWLSAAAALVLIGCILFIGVMTTIGWDFTKLSTVRYETNTYEITEAFRNISLQTDTAAIVFAPSSDRKCRVECYEEKNANHTVAVREDTLTIRLINTRAWYEYIGFHFGSPQITVYLPKTAYDALTICESTGNVEIPRDFTFVNTDISLTTGTVAFCASVTDTGKIKTSTGDIRVKNTSAGTLNLSVTTGAVTVSGVTCRDDITVGVSTGNANLCDVACQNVHSSGTTGSITLDRVIAASLFSIERTTGDIKFSGCDAAELSVKTSTGDISGSLLTDKVFITDTATSRVDVPQTATGGRCMIKTSTGDIDIKIG